MIIINEVLAEAVDTAGLQRHVLYIEWYETIKTILRRRTDLGLEVGIKKHNKIPLQDGDILLVDEEKFVQIEILSCDCIVVSPRDFLEMGSVCFDIGNMHLPIFIDTMNQVNVAYEAPLYEYLLRKKFDVRIENKKLLQTQMLSLHEKKR